VDADVAVDQRPQLLVGPQLGVGDVVGAALEPPHRGVHDRQQDVVLAAEVVVEGAERDLRAVGQFAHRRRRVAALGEQLGAGVED